MIDYFAEHFIAAILVFTFGTILVAVLSTAMSKAAVTLRDKARLPEGVIGGILIGVITSIPELISGITGVISYAKEGTAPGSPVFGDAIGSNMFCLFVLSIVLLVCIKMFVKREVNQTNTFTVIFIIIGTIFCFLACVFDNYGVIYPDGPSPLVWHGFNLFSVFIFASYGAAVFFMIFGSRRVKAKAVVIKGSETQTILPTSQKKKKSWFGSVNMGIVIFLFILFAVMLIVSSIFLAFSCEGLIKYWDLDKMFGHTLLLGVTTSLPEIISIINFVIDKEYNMAVDSTVGSCGFNLTILFISNVAYAVVYNPGALPGPQALFSLDRYSIMQLVLFMFEAILILGYIITNSQSIKQYLTKKQVYSINATLLSMVASTYVTYIALGFIYP